MHIENGSKICLLSDFGVGKIMGSGTDFAETQIGTLCSVSPEMQQNEECSYLTDIWALGCILHEMCMLKKPFNGDSKMEI